MMVPPSYDDLPLAPAGGRSAWGVFGADDELGTINLQTPERIAAAARLVRRGTLYPLNAPLDAFGHQQWGRRLLRHEVLHQPGSIFFDDMLHDFGLQGSSQWDSLAHAAYRPEEFYNGATEADVAQLRRNTIEHWAQRGIAGRGVLLDMPATMNALGEPYQPDSAREFTADDLEAARRRSGAEIEAGDILLLYTGFGRYYAGLTNQQRTERAMTSPGLAHSEDVVRWLWDHQLSAVASDNIAVEAGPLDLDREVFPFGALHQMLIGQLGMALGELWWLEDLAADCAGGGVAEMFVTSAPLNLTGGIGSPANVMAIK